ncbi:MFS transporter [Novosphingobium resinovorum]
MNTRLLVMIVLQALCLMYFLLSAGTFNSLGMVLPSMVEAFGMTWAQAGFGFTLLGTACGIVSLAPALTIRKLGIGRTLAAGTVILFVAFWLLYTSTGVMGYYLGTTLLGIGYCFCGTVPAVHILSSSFRRRSTVLGLYFTIGNLGAVAGPLLWYGSQSAGFDWRFYWLLFAVASVVVGAFAPSPPDASTSPRPRSTSRPRVHRPSGPCAARSAPCSSGWWSSPILHALRSTPPRTVSPTST